MTDSSISAIVVDTSVIADALFLSARRDLRTALARQTLHAPALIDYEFLSVARGFVLGGQVTAHRAQDALTDFGELGIRRHPMTPALREAVWELRTHTWLTAYDAPFAALALLLGAPLWTLDERLARACPSSITVVQEWPLAAGEVVSDLARQSLTRSSAQASTSRGDFPLLPSRGRPVTNALVERLRNEEHV